MQGTASLSVEAHNFGKGLSNDHLKASVQEVTQTNTILVEVASDEALISSVEEGIEEVLLANASNLLPLSESRVDTGGVVGACVQEHGRAGSGVLQVLDHAIEVQALGLLVEVAVGAHLKASSSEDGVVVAPSGRANIDGRRSVLHQEVSDNAEGTGAGQSLGRCNAARADVGVVPAEEYTSGTLVEVLVAVNGRVLLVELVVVTNHLFSLANNGEHVGLAVLRAVGTDAEVNLVGVGVGLVTGRQREDGVGGCLLHVAELPGAASGSVFGSDDLSVEIGESLHL